MNGKINTGMPSMTLPGGVVNEPDVAAIAKFVEEMKKDKELAAVTQKQKESNDVGSASIQAAGQLIGDLFAQSSAAQRAKAQAQLDAAKIGAETQVAGLRQSSKDQQDAFTRLMGSMRSALVGG